jgi:hypothetical protein
MSPTSMSPSSCRAPAWYVLNIDLVLTTGITCFNSNLNRYPSITSCYVSCPVFIKRVLDRSVYALY